jgi:hypothetical protein
MTYNFLDSETNLLAAAFTAGREVASKGYPIFVTWKNMSSVFRLDTDQQYAHIREAVRKQFILGYKNASC